MKVIANRDITEAMLFEENSVVVIKKGTILEFSDEIGRDGWKRVWHTNGATWWWVKPDWIDEMPEILSVGDKVVYPDGGGEDWPDIEEGATGTIVQVDMPDISRWLYCIKLDDENGTASGYAWARLTDVELITAPVFSVGDTVRLIADKDGGSLHSKGETAVIEEVDDEDYALPYKVRYDKGGHTYWVKGNVWELVSKHVEDFTDSLEALFNSVEAFYERFNVDPYTFKRQEMYDIFVEEVRELRDEFFNSDGLSIDLNEEAVDVMVTVLGMLWFEMIEFEQIKEAVKWVIAKNAAKTTDTHYYDEKRGKIVRLK